MTQATTYALSDRDRSKTHRSIWVNLISILLLTACSSEVTMESIIIPDLATPPPPPPQEDTARFVLLRTARWPGGGREMTLGILNQATGAAFPQDLSARLVAQPPEGITIKMKVQRQPVAPGYTALLLPPKQTATERTALSQAILAFAAKRPVDERIALYRHGDTVQLFSNFLTERIKLAEALDRYQKGIDSDSNPLPLVQAIGPAASDVSEVGGAGPDVMRSLVVLAKDPQSVYINLTNVYVIPVAPDATGLSAASGAIDDARQNAFYKVATCGPDAKFSAKLQVSNTQGDLSASFLATLPEEVGAPCNVDAIDTAKRVYTPRLELVFDDAQRAAHDARIRATQTATYDDVLARSDFETQIRLAPGQPTILATAHLHGNGSIRCERKSYTIKLDGPDRYLMPGSATDEYTLISMCDDLAYMYAPTAYGLFAEDLFSLKRRFVEFVIDGKTRGIYLLLEKTKEEQVRDSARVTSVMRRQYPQGANDFFEVLHPDTGDLAAPLNRFRAFAAQIAPLTGDALVSALRNQLDLDQYLRYLAHQSVLRSGDYIDEVYFTGTEQANGMGGTTETYRVMAWDPEGYTNCHSGGVNAYPDANNMAYCAEGKLDAKILADPKVYKIYSQKVDDALNITVTRAKMAAALDQTKTSLQALLVTPAICAAMIELLKINPGAADCAVARSVVAARADAILAAYDARRTYLLAQLATYKAKP